MSYWENTLYNDKLQDEVVKLLNLFAIFLRTGVTLRISDYLTDIVFDGNTYQKGNIALGPQTSEKDGMINETSIAIGDVGGSVWATVEVNKAAIENASVEWIQVHRDHLLLPATAFRQTKRLRNTFFDGMNVTGTLSGSMLFTYFYPRNQHRKNFCGHQSIGGDSGAFEGDR